GRPGQLIDVLLAGHERAVDAVERIVETIARDVDDELAILAVDLGVDDRVLGDLVVVVGVVRGVLEAPLDLAVRWADREHACGPFVVAGPIFRIVVRAGIADALIERVALRIVGGSLPDRRAAMFPVLLAILPGLIAGLAGTRNRIGTPQPLSGVEIGSFDESTDAVFAPGCPDDRHIAHHQWSMRERLAERRVGDLALPHLLASRLVDREQPATKRDGDDLVLPQRHAAVVDAAAGDVSRPGAIGLGIEFPAQRRLLAAGDVIGIDDAPAVGDVHDAVLDYRGRFEIAGLVARAGALDAIERH